MGGFPAGQSLSRGWITQSAHAQQGHIGSACGQTRAHAPGLSARRTVALRSVLGRVGPRGGSGDRPELTAGIPRADIQTVGHGQHGLLFKRKTTSRLGPFVHAQRRWRPDPSGKRGALSRSDQLCRRLKQPGQGEALCRRQWASRFDFGLHAVPANATQPGAAWKVSAS